MLRRNRERWGMREGEAAWRSGLNVREYRELEAGTLVDVRDWDRLRKLYGSLPDEPQSIRRSTPQPDSLVRLYVFLPAT
jgi:hypothetical protein